jgi:Arc/MetJ family transcription regulator
MLSSVEFLHRQPAMQVMVDERVRQASASTCEYRPVKSDLERLSDEYERAESAILGAVRADAGRRHLATAAREVAVAAGKLRVPTRCDSVSQLIARIAHLRADFVLDDLILMLKANGGLHATSTNARVAASRRFAALAIRAFRA